MIDSPIFFSLVLSWYNSLLYETPKGQQSIKNNSGTLHWYDHTILKFMFSKETTKIEKIFTVNLTLT